MQFPHTKSLYLLTLKIYKCGLLYKNMKKGWIILLSLVLLFSIIFLIKLNVVKAQDEMPGLPISTGQMEQIENLSNSLPNKWEYLQKEWKTILTKNKVMNAIDSFMNKKIPSWTFRILFGNWWNIEYLPTIIGVMLLWIFCFVGLANLGIGWRMPTKNQELSGFLSYVLAFLVTWGIANLHIFYNVVVWLGKLIFQVTNPWIRFAYFLLVIVGLVFFVSMADALGKASKKKNEQAKEEELEQKVEKADKYLRGVKTGKNMVGR